MIDEGVVRTCEATNCTNRFWVADFCGCGFCTLCPAHTVADDYLIHDQRRNGDWEQEDLPDDD